MFMYSHKKIYCLHMALALGIFFTSTAQYKYKYKKNDFRTTKNNSINVGCALLFLEHSVQRRSYAQQKFGYLYPLSLASRIPKYFLDSLNSIDRQNLLQHLARKKYSILQSTVPFLHEWQRSNRKFSQQYKYCLASKDPLAKEWDAITDPIDIWQQEELLRSST